MHRVIREFRQEILRVVKAVRDENTDLHDRTSLSRGANASRLRMGSTLKRSRNSNRSLGRNAFMRVVTASASASPSRPSRSTAESKNVHEALDVIRLPVEDRVRR